MIPQAKRPLYFLRLAGAYLPQYVSIHCCAVRIRIPVASLLRLKKHDAMVFLLGGSSMSFQGETYRRCLYDKGGI